jgi:hypothetical protein
LIVHFDSGQLEQCVNLQLFRTQATKKYKQSLFHQTVIWNIQLQCCGSGMFIPDPGSEVFPSRIRIFSIPDFESASNYLSILTQTWFLSSWKYDPSCSYRIRILILYPSRIQGSKRHRIPDPQHCSTKRGLLSIQTTSMGNLICLSIIQGK